MLAQSYSGEMAALVTALMWVLCSLAFTSAGKQVGSLSVNFIRLVIAFVFFAAAGLIFRGGRVLPTDASLDVWTWLALSGVVGFFFGDLCLFKAFLLIGPRLTLLITALVPPLTAVMAMAVLGEHLTWLNWLGMGVTLAGVAWVVLERPGIPESSPPAGDGPVPVQSPAPSQRKLFGILLALGGTVGQAGGVILVKKGIGNYDPFAGAHIRLIAATVCFAVLITLLGRWGRVWRAMRHRRAMSLLTFGALTGPFIGVSVQIYAVMHTSAGVATTLMATSPVIILPFVIVLHREKVTVRAWLGAGVALAGIFLLCYDAFV